ncbi:hemicentin-1-like [Mercenaria mercenaria]|uniref:hemicentin-1-like n=1 Tax=Mercenaria mercenaria TaxID=6596 RepID=UPI00234F9981|nr:hemicentin-1-like [Mercenaria mercenaria]
MLRIYCSLVTILFIHLTISVVIETSEKRSYKILEGDNLLVICNVTDSPDTDVFWTKNDTKMSFMQQGKRLEILNIKRSYSGDYICHALNTTFPVPDYNETDVNKTIDVINVDVQYPAEVDFFGIGPYELLENSTFTVTCDMQANPQPTWTIRNRDTGLELMSAAHISARSTIGPVTARCEHMGYWECTGKNSLSHGVNASKGHNLTVFCPPRPQFQHNQYLIQTTVGKYTEMKMYLQAYPIAIYTWSKDDGTDISKSVTQEDFANETTLTFSMISVPDFGNYTLKMQNEYGIYYAHYQVVANGPPERPTNFHSSDITYNSVKLQWTSGFDMGSKQHFIVMKLIGNQFIQISNWVYDNSTNHGINQNWTYVLTGLVSDTYYNLTVVSENDRGFMSSFAKPSISFKTKSKYLIKLTGIHTQVLLES